MVNMIYRDDDINTFYFYAIVTIDCTQTFEWELIDPFKCLTHFIVCKKFDGIVFTSVKLAVCIPFDEIKSNLCSVPLIYCYNSITSHTHTQYKV